MRLPKNIPVWAFEGAIALSALIWGASFVVVKGALDAVTPGWLVTIRFAVAGLVLSVIFWRRLRNYLDVSHVLAGVMIGVPAGLAYLIQNVGLVGTTPGRNAFLTTTYCVMVPFFNWALLRRRPGANNVAAALMALVGVGLLSLGDSGADLSPSLSSGDALTLVSACFFALNIVAVGRYAAAHDYAVITIVMFAVSSLICAVYALVAEPLPDLAAMPADFWWQMSYVALLSTALAPLLQNLAQRHVEPSKAALLFSLESVFAVAFSVLLYGERLTLRLVAGFALIFFAVLVSELVVSRGGARAGRQEGDRDARAGR